MCLQDIPPLFASILFEYFYYKLLKECPIDLSFQSGFIGCVDVVESFKVKLNVGGESRLLDDMSLELSLTMGYRTLYCWVAMDKEDKKVR